jgi:predicted MFS family arabinose efflux permease
MVSLTGSWMQSTVVALLAYRLTGEAKWPAFLMVAQIGPTFLFGAWAGTLADRKSKRRLIMWTQVGFLINALVLTTLILTNSISIYSLLFIMLSHGLIQSIDLPARLAFVPDLVIRDDLINAVALNSLLFNVARAIGPAIAGELMANVGPGICIILNSLSYLAVIGALRGMTPIQETIHVGEPDTRGGFQILRSRPRMLMLVLLAGGVAISGWPLLSLLPAYTDRILGLEERFAARLLSSIGIGALIAALTAATFGSEARRLLFLRIGALSVMASLYGLIQVQQWWLAAVCCAVFGFGMILFLATGQSSVQLTVGVQERGKIMGVWAMMLAGGTPIGNLFLGPMADWVGVRSVLTLQALAMSAIVLILLLFAPKKKEDVV